LQAGEMERIEDFHDRNLLVVVRTYARSRKSRDGLATTHAKTNGRSHGIEA
jgi:hypothetical protein